MCQVIGRAAHDVTAQNLDLKSDEDTKPPDVQRKIFTVEALEDMASSAFLKEWDSIPVVLSEKEREVGLKRIKDTSKDRTIEMVLAHAKDIAPNIHPMSGGIEWKWVIECNGYPFDLSGQIDVKEVNGHIRDNKFRSRQITQNEVDTSEQLTVYALAKLIIDGEKPKKVWLDCIKLAEPGKSLTVRSLSGERSDADFTVFRNRFEQAVEVIEKGAFTPAGPSDWWCSERFCGFAADGSCPYFNKGRKTFPPPTRRSTSNDIKRVIPKGTQEWSDATR